MPCFVPLDDKKLDVSFFMFRSTGVFADELIAAMKYFSFHAEDLGCLYSSVLKSMHGNLVVWYGAWIRRSAENRQFLNDALLSVLEQVSHLGVLVGHEFVRAFFGETRDGKPLAKFSSGDTILLGTRAAGGRISDLTYAITALHKSFFARMAGVGLSACAYFQSFQGEPVIISLLVWESLGACYSWLVESDYRNAILPYLSDLYEGRQHDVFKVVYVSSDEVLLDAKPGLPPPAIGGGDDDERT